MSMRQIQTFDRTCQFHLGRALWVRLWSFVRHSHFPRTLCNRSQRQSPTRARYHICSIIHHDLKNESLQQRQKEERTKHSRESPVKKVGATNLRARQLPMTLHWYTCLAICPTRLKFTWAAYITEEHDQNCTFQQLQPQRSQIEFRLLSPANGSSDALLQIRTLVLDASTSSTSISPP